MTSRNVLSHIEGLKSHSSSQREDTYNNLINNFNNSVFSLNDKAELLKILSSKEFLFYKIDDGISNDSVARSFSILGIALIISDEPNFEIQWLVPLIVDYIQREKDYRGKTVELGWIHAYAHLGDLIAVLSTNTSVTIEDKELIVLKMLEKISSSLDCLFSDGEEQRLAKALFYMIDDNPTIDVDKIFRILASGKQSEVPMGINVKNIIDVLRIELLNEDKKELVLKLDKTIF